MISLITPSRGRPEQLVAMFHTALETAADDQSFELVVRVDDDDDSYDKLRSTGNRGQVRWIEGPRTTMSALWNDAWQRARGDIFMHCADDIRFRTADWDLHVDLAFQKLSPDRIGFVHGRDGAHDQALGTHGFLSREWTDVIGTFLPPYFTCDYADTWLNEVAEVIRRRVYLPEVLTEHMHPALGKGEIDQTHLDRFERDAKDNNTQRWQELAPQRIEWIHKLQAAIG